MTLFVASVHEILKRQADIQVVGEASGGQAGISAALELLPDLVLMDVSMPDVDGFEATRQIVASASAVKVLAYSAESDLGDRQSRCSRLAHEGMFSSKATLRNWCARSARCSPAGPLSAPG